MRAARFFISGRAALAIARWPRAGGAVQTPEAMLQNLDFRVRELNAVAARLYDRWIEGLAHGAAAPEINGDGKWRAP